MEILCELQRGGGLEIWPLFKDIQSRLRIGAFYQYWDELSQSGDFDDGDDSFSNVTLSIDYYLDAKQRIGVSLSYINGDDPAKGLLDQDYMQFGWVFMTGK